MKLNRINHNYYDLVTVILFLDKSGDTSAAPVSRTPSTTQQSSAVTTTTATTVTTASSGPQGPQCPPPPPPRGFPSQVCGIMAVTDI